MQNTIMKNAMREMLGGPQTSQIRNAPVSRVATDSRESGENEQLQSSGEEPLSSVGSPPVQSQLRTLVSQQDPANQSMPPLGVSDEGEETAQSPSTLTHQERSKKTPSTRTPTGSQKRANQGLVSTASSKSQTRYSLTSG
jgi:hypothetical protein